MCVMCLFLFILIFKDVGCTRIKVFEEMGHFGLCMGCKYTIGCSSPISHEHFVYQISSFWI